MNRFLLISVGTLSCILLGVLFGGSSASAVSDFDTFFDNRITDKLLLKNGTCDTVDVSNSIITNFVAIEGSTQTHVNNVNNAKDDFNSVLQSENGHWSIVQTDESQFTIRWSKNTESTISFERVNTYRRLKITPYSRTLEPSVTVYMDANCNIGIPSFYLSYPSGPSSPTVMEVSDTNNTNFPTFYLSTYPFVAPSGYEGEIPPDTAGNPECLRECRIVIAPNFEYDYDDKQISVTDLENDLLPEFEPDEGYTSLGYEIEWSLWKCSVEYDNGLCKNGENELIELKHKPLLEGNTWNNLEYGYYRVEAQYVVQQCYRYPSYPATPDYCFYVDLGTEFGKVYLFEKRSKSINLDGTSGSGNTSDENCDVSGECTSGTVGGLLPCFGPDPPYIQVDGCVKNIFWVVDSLSFSKITIMEIRSNTMQCKQLDTIGGWINRPGITVCPMFPSHVRDVVTPFITLAIGLFLGSFIMRLASRGVR